MNERLEDGNVDHDLDAWVELWHAMRGVVLVGHAPGGPCPMQVGHTLVEHVIGHHWPTVEARLQAVVDAGLHVPDADRSRGR